MGKIKANSLARMIVDCKLHNLSNLVFKILEFENRLFSLVDCEEFKMIRRPHIIIADHNNYN